MRSTVSALILATMSTLALDGCRVATEYVPHTPRRATIGVERGAVGVYKNGAFAKLGDPIPEAFGCSAPAASAATAAAAHEASFRYDSAIAGVGWGLMWLLPPLLGIGVGFGALADREREASFAFAVDAVNLHNDAAACIGSAAPAAGGRP